MFFTTGAGAPYHASAMYSTTGAGAAKDTVEAGAMFSRTGAEAPYTACAAGAREIFSPTGAGAAYATGAGHVHATTGASAASPQAQCKSQLCWCCVSNWRRRNHCGSWYAVLHDGRRSNVRRCRRNVLITVRRSNLRHCGSWSAGAGATQRLCCSQLKGCDAVTLVPTLLVSLVLAPNVLIGAYAEPNIRGHGQRL